MFLSCVAIGVAVGVVVAGASLLLCASPFIGIHSLI